MTLKELCDQEPNRRLWLRPGTRGFRESEALSLVICTIVGHPWASHPVELRPLKNNRTAVWVMPRYSEIRPFVLGHLESETAQRRRESSERQFRDKERARAHAVEAEIKAREESGLNWDDWAKLDPTEKKRRINVAREAVR